MDLSSDEKRKMYVSCFIDAAQTYIHQSIVARSENALSADAYELVSAQWCSHEQCVHIHIDTTANEALLEDAVELARMVYDLLSEACIHSDYDSAGCKRARFTRFAIGKDDARYFVSRFDVMYTSGFYFS